MKKNKFIDTVKFIKIKLKRILVYGHSRLQNAIGRYKFILIPIADANYTDRWNVFESTGNDPQIILVPKGRHYPTGPVELSLWMKTPSGNTTYFSLFYDLGKGFNTQDSLEIGYLNDKKSSVRLNLPNQTKGLRFDPCENVGEIIFRDLEIRKISKPEILRDIIRSREIRSLKDVMTLIKDGLHIVKSHGLSETNEGFRAQRKKTYCDWISLYDTLDYQSIELIKKSILNFHYKPLISILMPVYDTPENTLREALDSVLAQIYTNWELCIADDCSPNENVRKVIKEYAEKDSRIKYIFRQENGHISAASNTALSIASGEFVALLDHDDLLAETALYRVAQALNQKSSYDVIYSDEDKIDEDGRRYDPYFKPDWMPDLFNCQNFVSHLGVYRKKVVDSVGGFQVGYEGAQDWDLMMRISEVVPYDNITHLPFILYHWRAIQGSTAKAKSEKSYAEIAQERTIQDHFKRINIRVNLQAEPHGFWRVQYLLNGNFPKVSIIIPTKNHADILKRCITSVIEKTTFPNYEILVIDNGSSEKETLDYLYNLQDNNLARILEFPKAFNYSAINNFGVHQSKGEVVVLLNNDTEIISNNWLEEMVSLAIRPDTGAVGAKLYYPDDTIQHAGVILGIMGVANHAYLNQPRTTLGQMGRAMLTQNYSAVTGACLAVEKRKFLEVGGLNESDLKVAFNDIDFCIKLLMAGYHNVWTPYAELYHYESASRGYEDTPEKQERFNNEVLYMLDKWQDFLKNDPAYNLNLSLEVTNFDLAFPPRASSIVIAQDSLGHKQNVNPDRKLVTEQKIVSDVGTRDYDL